MCDRIKEDDFRNTEVRSILSKSGCDQINDKLNQCLKLNKRDFRKCKVMLK